jgi:hypothetical protein
MANRRASGPPGPGPLNTSSEGPFQPSVSKQRRCKHTGSQWLGPSDWYTWLSFKDDGGIGLGHVDCNIDIRPMRRKGHQRCSLQKGEPQTDRLCSEIQNAAPGVGNRQWQRMGQLTGHGLAHGKTIGFLYRESSAQANLTTLETAIVIEGYFASYCCARQLSLVQSAW